MTSNWERLGESFYRKQEIYSLLWSINDLSTYSLYSAKNAGPIALIRDDTKPILLGQHDSSLGKRKISIYTSAGGLLQTIIWDSPSRIIALGWTARESLIVLTQAGIYRIYALSTTSSSTGSTYSQHSLGPEAQDVGVLEAKIWEDGMVVLLADLTFVAVRNWDSSSSTAMPISQNDNEESSGSNGGGRGGRISRLAKYHLQETPHCWCVIPPESSTSGGVEVLISVGVTIVRLDEIEAIDHRITRGPFNSISPSPTSSFLALLSHSTPSTPLLWVTSSDFTRSLSEFDLSTQGEIGTPDQMVWCGSHTVVVAWDKCVLMVGPFGESIKYYYTNPIHLISELDGTRIISRTDCEFLQKVPQSLQSIFTAGSTTPAALLFEASDLYHEKRSPKADELIRGLRSRGDLLSAVEECLDAAGREWEVVEQKKLLKAASFGKTFLELYNPTQFVQMTQTLRVLNAVRFYEIGIPLSFDQYKAHPPSHLIALLTSRSLDLLALRIAGYLGLTSSIAGVLTHWAMERIGELPPTSSLPSGPGERGSERNEERALVKRIVEMLRTGGGGGVGGSREVSCADIAESAWRNGRASLATLLLDHEPRAAKQVPLLLKMKEDNLAVVKAIESGDPDLVSSVLLSLYSSHSLGNFFRLIDNKPDAISLLQVYAKENDVELLRDFWYQDDRRVESGAWALKESWAIEDFGDKVAKVRVAAKLFSEDKDCVFESKMIADQIKLLAFQQTLDQESGTAATSRSYIGLSLNETIKSCIVAGLEKKAEKLRSEWKVSDKRWWYLKLAAHIATRDFATLLAFSKSKRSPIGYEPFVLALIAAGAQREAVSYVGRCDSAKRVDLLVKAGEWVGAGRECVRKGSRDELVDLRSRCPNSIIAAQLDELLEEMRNGMS